MLECDFGCGQIASKQFKNGKWCCSSSVSSCPAQKNKNSLGIKKFISQLENPNLRWKNGHPRPLKGKVPHNKGKTLEQTYGEDRAVRMKQVMSLTRAGRPGRSQTEETCSKLSQIAKSRNLGGYKNGSGRGKKGWYKGYYCDSSWELAYLIYCLDNNIDIKRNKTKIQYTWKDKVRNYTPDFVVNGCLVEIKGFRTEQWEAKLAASPNVVVLYEKEMAPIIEWVVAKYGTDYIRLYGE